MSLHVSFDECARLWKERTQNASNCFLVVAMFWWSGWSTEGFFQKRNANTLSAAHFFKLCRRPVSALHHLCKKSQSHRYYFSFLR